MRMALQMPDAERLHRMQRLYMRVVGMVFLALALQSWVRVTGVLDGAQFRFDTMSEHWRLASSVLCVLLPVAALGLWAGEAWGAVLWIAAASTAIAMHVMLPELYGRSDLLVAFHILGLATLAAFRLALILASRKK